MFASNNNAFFGLTFKATTQEPQNGSIHLPNGRTPASRRMSGASFVLMPWHFSGGVSVAVSCFIEPARSKDRHCEFETEPLPPRFAEMPRALIHLWIIGRQKNHRFLTRRE